MSEDHADIKMDWDLWCPVHLEPLRATWPSGSMIAMVGLFNASVQEKRMVDAADGKVENVSGVMQIIKPVCCWLNAEHPGMAEKIIEKALAGEVWPVVVT